MKKLLSILLTAAMLLAVLTLVSCGGESAEDPAGIEVTDVDEVLPVPPLTLPLSVEKGLFRAELVFPAGFGEGETAEDLKAFAEERGYRNCVLNEDGTVTLTMSRRQYDGLMKRLKKTVSVNLRSLTEGDDFPFTDVRWNDDFSVIDYTVDSETYTLLHKVVLLPVSILSGVYQGYLGKPTEDLTVTVNLIDAETGEIFDSFSSGGED